jgi:CheY-like chemotaxis protein
MVVEPNAERRDITEAILMKLRFAVVPVDSVEKALDVTRAVRPNVIVCPAPDAERIREELVQGEIPVVEIPDDPDELIENIRFALRARVIRMV